jgi:hypothetical protein
MAIFEKSSCRKPAALVFAFGVLLSSVGGCIRSSSKRGVIGFAPGGETVAVWSSSFFSVNTWHYGPHWSKSQGLIGWARSDSPEDMQWTLVPGFYPSLRPDQLSFSPNGKYISVGKPSKGFVLDLANDMLKQVNEPEDERLISRIGWLSNEEISYATMTTHEVDRFTVVGSVKVFRQRIDAPPGMRKEVFSAHIPQAATHAHRGSQYVSPDGRFIVLDVFRGAQFLLIDVLTGKSFPFAQQDAQIRKANIDSVAWSPDSSQATVIVRNYRGNTIHLLATKPMTSRVRHETMTFSREQQTCILPSSGRLAFFNRYHQCEILDRKTVKTVDVVPTIRKTIKARGGRIRRIRPLKQGSRPGQAEWVLVMTADKTYAVTTDGERCVLLSDTDEAVLNADGDKVLEMRPDGRVKVRSAAGWSD